MYVVGFNGPPRSGKDTLARMLKEYAESVGTSIPFVEVSLSHPLRKLAYTMTGNENLDLDGPDYERFKETKFDRFGVTGRQLMIDVSERFLKPCYGQSVMADLLMTQYPIDTSCVLLIRDNGFQCEMDPILQEVGGNNFFVVRVQREGTTFDGDSREWVYHPSYQCNLTVHNDSDLDSLRFKAELIFHNLVNQFGWRF